MTGTSIPTTENAQADYNAVVCKVTANAMDCMPIGDALRYHG